MPPSPGVRFGGGVPAFEPFFESAGGYQDIEGDGYYHFGARYYDTKGHFTQPDSIQGICTRPEKFNSYQPIRPRRTSLWARNDEFWASSAARFCSPRL